MLVVTNVSGRITDRCHNKLKLGFISEGAAIGPFFVG